MYSWINVARAGRPESALLRSWRVPPAVRICVVHELCSMLYSHVLLCSINVMFPPLVTILTIIKPSTIKNICTHHTYTYTHTNIHTHIKHIHTQVWREAAPQACFPRCRGIARSSTWSTKGLL